MLKFKSVTVRGVVIMNSVKILHCADIHIGAAESFLKLGYSTESSLYESGGKYRLIVSCPEAPLAPSGFFSEFAKTRECDDMLCEFTREHWRELAAHGALEALCGA